MTQEKRTVGKRGPDKQPRKRYTKRGENMRGISIRLPEEVITFFGGCTTAMRAGLVAHMEEAKKRDGVSQDLTMLGSVK